MSISMLNRAVELRLWLSDEFHADQDVPISGEPELNEYVLKGKFPLRSSLAAQQLTRLPFTLLTWAVACFLVGFGLYLGFAWQRHADTEIGANDNRNVFIVFMIVTLLSVTLFIIWLFLKAAENIQFANPRADDPRQRRLMASLLYVQVQQKLEPIKHFRNKFQSIPTVLPRRGRPLPDEKVSAEGRLRPTSKQQRARNPVDWSLMTPASAREASASQSPTPASSLRRALEEAAMAHKACAEADLAVATEYERLAAANPA